MSHEMDRNPVFRLAETAARCSFVVAADGSGDFASVQAAVDAIPPDFPERVTIFIRQGEYREKVFIDRRKVSLIGEGADRTAIRWDDYALKTFPDGEPYNTFNTYTLFAGADDFIAEDLSIVNGAGRGEDVGQAVALYADGDRAVFRRCRLIGWQDTLFTGPLPPSPVERATFGGPREGAPRRPSRQYYEDCYIEGDVDFIFGSATAVFNRCELFSKARRESPEDGEDRVHGWIAAPSTPEDAAFGYLFLSCRLTGDAPPRSVYLGRPWRDFASAAFVRCDMGAHIRPEGWHDWDKPGARRTARFAEYGSAGPGAPGGHGRAGAANGPAPEGRTAAARVDWSRQLTSEEADEMTVDRVLAGADGWNPLAAKPGMFEFGGG